jgi:hypothetical protein
LEASAKELIKKCDEKGLFANPPVTELVYVESPKSKDKKETDEGEENPEEDENIDGE